MQKSLSRRLIKQLLIPHFTAPPTQAIIVCRQQTIVCSRQTIVCRQQTIVWWQQTNRLCVLLVENDSLIPFMVCVKMA